MTMPGSTAEGGPSQDDLVRLDARITALRQDAARAHQSWWNADAALRTALAERHELARRLSATAPSTTAPATTAPAAAWAPATERPPEALPMTTAGAAMTPATGPETSTRTVQNVLFVLGGLLLGSAAIAFTIVAWTTFGLVGQAIILAVVTILALTVPAVALPRGLRATSETFGAIGLLLVILDGYAVWHVNLAGVQSIDGGQYVGIVAGLTALIASGYGWLTRLSGPAFVALLTAQPVVVLLAAPANPGAAGMSLLVSAVAAADALVVAGVKRAATIESPRWTSGVVTGLSAVAWLAFGLWVATAGIAALVAEVTTSTLSARVAAGAAMVTVSLVLLLGGWVSGLRPLRTVTAGLVVPAVVVAALFVGVLAWPGHFDALVASAAVTAAVIVRLVGVVLPEWLRPGPRWAAAAGAGLALVVYAMVALVGAVNAVEAATPFWSARLAATGPNPPAFTWELPVALAGLTVAALLTCPRWTVVPVAVFGGVLAVLALPASAALAWWAPSALGLGGAAVLTTTFLLLRRRRANGASGSAILGAAVLAGDAVLTSLARPGLTSLTLGAVVVLGLFVATLARRTPREGMEVPADSAPQASPEFVGAAALVTGLLALPPAIGSALRAFDVQPWWAVRATVAAAAVLLVAVAAVRSLTHDHYGTDRYVVAAFLAAVTSGVAWPLAATAVGEEPTGIYSGLSLLVLAGALAAVPEAASRFLPLAATAALPPAILYLVAVLPSALLVTFGPYSWLSAVWTGQPAGVGVAASSAGMVPAVDAVALGLLALTSAVVHYAFARRWRVAVTGLAIGGPTAVLATVVATEAPWPTLPVATMLVGLALVLPVALIRTDPWRTAVLSGQGAISIGGGVAGSLGAEWSTLTALGVVVVAACVVGAGGRTPPWRVVGCLVAVAAALAEAAAAGLAVDLPLRTVAFAVLGAGVVALHAGALLRRTPSRRLEAIATEAAANGAAVVAVTLTVGSLGWSAGVCAVWGLALATRAMVPGITAGTRTAYAAAGGGLEVVAWWLLVADREVTLVEAYTLPLAALALAAGWAAQRTRPELRSWVAYGPALLAGFLPTLATVITTVGEPWRRLALFVAALVVVMLGSVHRRQAPVVIGGTVLVVVALHELVLVWQRLPGWVPLAMGGAILLFLAITYERRRRDVGRLRSALDRMT